ncbi:hypothetical protein Ais01nite_58870 [Asanoa ishikariensis]|uniref:Right handed beta helix region n=1 Tax=Asanoa ishikariensis TaxID=137265 RepID=A0A1H3PF61_9ACTN|nr:hypothetical protein [Asanoa ishikariensis]GIF67852.1 hypothetical protein Ais01nite_58870 [Asanoa ishikariensis]SDY99720.1 hypothetical protein SAMN05421684_2838 [Asanoa ishikariensis]
MRKLRARVCAAAVMVAVVAVPLAGRADPSTELPHVSASAWLPSIGTGTLVRTNATRGEPDAELKLPADALVVQGAGHVVLFDRAAGTATPVDTALLRYGAAVPFGEPLGEAVVDGRGTIWFAVLGRGAVVPMRAGVAGPAVTVTRGGDTLPLVVVAGRAMAVDATTQSLVGLDGAAAAPLPAELAGRPFHAGGSTDQRVAAFVTGSRLVVSWLDTRTTEVVDLPARRPGRPVVAGHRVIVPDGGRLLVHDLDTGATEAVTVADRPATLDVFAQDGLVWANAPDGPEAMVWVDDAWRRIRKYGTRSASTKAPRPRPTPSTTVRPEPSPSERETPGPSVGGPQAGPSPGGGGPRPSPAAGGLRCGGVLTADGALDRDLRCSGTAGITIAADGVTLDLRGHTLSFAGPPPAGAEPIGVAARAVRDVQIRNGVVTGFLRQVELRDSRDVTLTDVRLKGNRGLRAVAVSGLRLSGVSIGPEGRNSHALTVTESTVDVQESSIVGDNSGCFLSTCRFVGGNLSVDLFEATGPLTMRGTTVWCKVCHVHDGGTAVIRDGEIRRLNMPGGLPRIVGNRITGPLRLGLNPDSPYPNGGPAVERNDIVGSALVVDAQSAGRMRGMRIVGNTVSGAPGQNFYSSGEGIRIDVPEGSDILVAGNTVRNSRGYGISAPQGVLDGGGNTSDTGCVGVRCG